jgi:hypothetical protein
MRDPVAEIVEYNKPLVGEGRRVLDDAGHDLTREALLRKLDALAFSPFVFFRGTFHLMAKDLIAGRVPGTVPHAAEGLIVGDLHVENFGVYRGSAGRLCFDVNDFDDVGFGPMDLDLRRLCTSAMLLPGVAPGARAAAARALAKAWAEAVERIGGRHPVAPFDEEKAEPPVSALLLERGKRTRDALLDKLTGGKGHRAFVTDAEPRKAVRPNKAWVQLVERSFDEYLASLAQLKVDVSRRLEIFDVVYRFKGTGSLGRLRFQLLVGSGDERRVLEVKEARHSALDEAKGAPLPNHRARVQTAAIRRLQGSPWPLVAGTHLGKLSALCREIQPEEEKIGSDRFAAGHGDPDHALLQAYVRQCGDVTGRLLMRENAPRLLCDPSFDAQAVAKAAVEFGERYAAQVEADQRAFANAKADVVKALGL